jgi:dihydroxyacid dehydratase/phosphogluconate dehydratase
MIDDAFALDMAMGGSTNTVLHTPVVAHEQVFHILQSASIPWQIKSRIFVKSARQAAGAEDVHRAGGVPAI